MSEQNFANHRQTVPMFHGGLSLLIFATLVGSVVNLYESLGDHQRLYSASLIVALSLAAGGLFVYTRLFPLKAQDRAIRAEEALRHFALTNKLLDARLTVGQIVALRFASDAEFVGLAQRAAAEGLSPNDIKRAIRSWRADTHRV